MTNHKATETREALDREDRKRRSAAAIDRIQALDDVERRVILAYLCGWATEDVEHTLNVMFGDREDDPMTDNNCLYVRLPHNHDCPAPRWQAINRAHAALDRFERELHGDQDILVGRALTMAVDLAAAVRSLLAVIEADREPGNNR